MSDDFEHGAGGSYEYSNKGFEEQLKQLHEERMQKFISPKKKDAYVGLLKYGLCSHVRHFLQDMLPTHEFPKSDKTYERFDVLTYKQNFSFVWLIVMDKVKLLNAKQHESARSFT